MEKTEYSTMESFRISCRNIPKVFFDDKNTAKNHFRQFGRIKKIIFKPKSRVCTVEYLSSDSSQKAINLGCMYENHIFEIVKEIPQAKKKRVKKQDDPDWLPDEDVMEELNGMGGGPSLALKKKYNLRPEGSPETKKGSIKQQGHNIQGLIPTRMKTDLSTTKSDLSEDQLELFNIIKKSAQNIDEKYKILDARDKLIRLLLKKVGTKTGATKGTCPDMCPEKERLLREIQHQVSIYEQDSARELNPSLAVKQYSRSSADQESPLSHELRPVKVLQMTMSYLIHRIMNLGDNSEVNLGEWYHFLWDRTRSIRKDITQQELCSQGSVALVEQCARFHIHCSARLVAEDPSVFDQKINTENLTKCLQTLKYMYNDLRLKGVSCPNEAEFRAYIILLNLNDGNFMWEVQKLQLEIQKSSEIKNAINVYSAIDKNNFIKFFKLVRGSTYLNACILMRYFMQIRIRAINILLKCYSPRITKVVYPLDKLTETLAFESLSHTKEFLQSCGLVMNATQTGVILDKTMFTTPDFTYTALDRSLNVVESKRKDLTIGQVVCRGATPPEDFANHVPHDSFDVRGFLVVDPTLMSSLELMKNAPRKAKRADNPIKILPKVTTNVNPFVFIKDGQQEKSKSVGFEMNVISSEKGPVNIPKSSIFSLDNRKKKNDAGEFQSKIFGNRSSEDSQENSERMGSNKNNGNMPTFEKNSSQNVSNIFGKPKEIKGNIFGSVTKIPTRTNEKEKQLNTNIFGGTKTSVQGEIGSIKTSDKSTKSFGNDKLFIKKDETDFKEIKWDIDSPEKPNSIQDVFFQQTSPSKPPLQKLPGGFSFPSFTFTPIVDNEANKNFEQKEKNEKERKQRELEEKEKIAEEEKRKLEKEKEEQIKKLEFERRIAQSKRKLEEEQKRKLKEEEYAREREKKKMGEIKTAIDKLIPEILEKVESRVREEKLIELKAKFQTRSLLKMFQKWHRITQRMKKKRKAIDCSPMLLSCRNPKEEAAELFTQSQNVALRYMKRYKLGKPLPLNFDETTTIKRIDLNYLSNLISKRYCEMGIKFYKDIYWKGVISLPGVSEMPDGRGRVEDTLKRHLQWNESKGETVLLDQHIFNNVQSVKYCIEKQSGLEVRSYDANGFIFIGKTYNQLLCRRILENVKDFGVFVRVPIVILLQEEPPPSMNFDVLVKQGIISDYLFLVGNFNPKLLVNNIEKGLEFLVAKTETPPPVRLDTMKSLLIKNLCTEIWKKASSFCRWNEVYKNCLKDPSVVIGLYHEALKKLKDLMLNKSCYEYASFPSIFKEMLPSQIPEGLPCDYRYFPGFCKEKNYFDRVSRVLDELELEIVTWWPPKDQIDLEISLSQYCTRVFKEPERPYYRLMAVFLNYCERSNEFSNIRNLVWTEVIEVIALEKIREIEFSLDNTEFFGKSIFNQLVVIYDPSSLNDFCNSDWFYVNNEGIKKRIEANAYVARKDKDEPYYAVSSKEIDEAIAKARRTLKDVDHSNMKNQVEEFKILMSDLEESLLINKKIASDLNQKMENIVDND